MTSLLIGGPAVSPSKITGHKTEKVGLFETDNGKSSSKL